MNLIEKITLKNFRCFRPETDFDLSQSTYFVGVNNAGKSAVLAGLRSFFDDGFFQDDSFLNKTEFLSRKKGSNKSEISLVFNIEALSSPSLKKQIIKDIYGPKSKNAKVLIKKNITLSESGKIAIDYQINNRVPMEISILPKEIQKLFASISINYIHPQEGKILLKQAQDKLRTRLLANWGRNVNLTQAINVMEKGWGELKKLSTNYLSKSLTESIQQMWPGSQTFITLPKSIKELIGISEISLKAEESSPEISLTNQGTGVQSTILYHTHFLLDSDMTLHRGEYHPIWLIEEPESFLHADLTIELGQELNSKKWLENIQMLIATHSPILLATARRENEDVRCTILKDFGTSKSKLVKNLTEEEINDIGSLMGDNNFYAYFNVSFPGNKAVFIEDQRIETTKAFERSGISVAKGLKGVPEIAKHLAVIMSNPQLIKVMTYFVVDADSGLDQLQPYIVPANLVSTEKGFKKFTIPGSSNVFLVLLPDKQIVEDLFSEYDTHLDSCIFKLFDVSTNQMKSSTPHDLLRTGAMLKSKKFNTLNPENEIKSLIKNEQEVKDMFWTKISENNLLFSQENIDTLSKLLNK